MSQHNRDSIGNILTVAVSVCLVASILVSVAAVGLKPAQDANRLLNQRQNILVAAGLLAAGARTDEQGRGINELFDQFEVRVVDLRTGDYVDDLDPQEFDQLRSARDPAMSRRLDGDEDKPTLRRLEQYGIVYLIRDADGDVEKTVLPVRGMGLWGTMFGYLAIEGDLVTAEGIAFYRHQETPGLGGEIENPRWRAQWEGLRLFDDEGRPTVELVKTRAPEGSDARQHQVDMLAGATLTSRGVENLVNFWLSDLGYGAYLDKLRRGEV
ncbi:MAG: Na(+)-translocating NADH-quinone reductase subunit C [Gammaproteobacteria bacterium]|nr:MAG: Na(+)-translocating NADH-quinone reductase subunit C [Gammaproteobacteria bacterium]